ncbi:MAG TPA: Hpt domain-containing protein [Gammaproteobacteria bacterium]|jgi:HPt (histidine-containing phosphotransfer) domain-containing protein
MSTEADTTGAIADIVAMEVLDRVALSTLARDVAGVSLQELIAAFVTELRDRAVRVENGAATGDFGTIGHESHALKSSAATFGAVRVASIAAALDAACKADRTEPVPVLVRALKTCIEPTVSALLITGDSGKRRGTPGDEFADRLDRVGVS